MSGSGQVSKKNTEFEHLEHSQPQLERFFLGTNLRLGKSLNNGGSVAKACESLVRLADGAPKICFGVADVAGRKFFTVPVVRLGEGPLYAM